MFKMPIQKQSENKIVKLKSQNINRIRVDYEFEKIKREMTLMGRRERTIQSYEYHLNKFLEINEIEYIDEINRDAIFNYLDYKNVGDVTRSNRLKCIKTTLNKFYSKNLIESNFWQDINITINTKIKKGANEDDIVTLLSNLDYSSFAQYRDATAILLMWETGVRVGTVARLKADMINYNENLIHFDGSVMKNHQAVSLPISADLSQMLRVLTDYNRIVLEKVKKDTDLVFITENGNSIQGKANNTVLSKRLADYCQAFNLPPISAHDIRRGFARRLLDKGVPITIISRALTHGDIAVTTKYLHVSDEEVIDSIRNTWEDDKYD